MLCPRCGSEVERWVSRCDNCGLVLNETRTEVDHQGPYRTDDIVAERYEIRERICSGPLYWSYVGYDQELEELVFIRVVRQTILARTGDHDVLVRSLEPLTNLTFPNVVRPLRAELFENNTLIVSEFVDGLPLRRLVELRHGEGRAFSASETLSVICSIAEALEAVAPVTAHGDLRPAHILILDESLKVDAFGFAPGFPREETVRALKDSPDACCYLAPEVLEGQLGHPAADIYSLAMIAGEMLSGRVPPALGGDLTEFLRHQPPLVSEMLRKSLSRNPVMRDASPSEFCKALAAVLGVENLGALRPYRPDNTVSADLAEPTDSDSEGTRPNLRAEGLVRPSETLPGMLETEEGHFETSPDVTTELEAGPYVTSPDVAPFEAAAGSFERPPDVTPEMDIGLESAQIQHHSSGNLDPDDTLKTNASVVELAVAALEAEEGPLEDSLEQAAYQDRPGEAGVEQIANDGEEPDAKSFGTKRLGHPKAPGSSGALEVAAPELSEVDTNPDPEMPTDPNEPAWPAKGGTKEFSSDELDTAHRSGADESEPEVERDPWLPAQPAAEGTQQITDDMLEPADERGIERDPWLPAQPAAEGTQQITDDMLEPVDEAYESSVNESERSFEERSEGLDPRLVRAARHLDRERQAKKK